MNGTTNEKRRDVTRDHRQAGMPVKTGIQVGEGTNLADAMFFQLLDLLQKPTDWTYDLLVLSSEHPS